MTTKKAILVLLIPLLQLIIFPSQLVSVNVSADQDKSFYIVYMGDRPADEQIAINSHAEVLSSVKQSPLEAKESVAYSYTKSFNAFAAKLSKEEATKLSQMNNVLSVIPNGYRKLHTTKSWDFIGLPHTAKRKLKSESDIVVGLLDTGITPSSDSFRDDGFGPPPAKWKGTCQVSANFTCNNKLIGARYFKLDGNPDPEDVQSPMDAQGHGTHTSSTAAGRAVPNASLFGLAGGTARGGVPSARVAMYKVCWASTGCADMDILAAFDAAIHDGVDVISISVGGFTFSYMTDAIAVGSFHAMRNGILTVASAGNDGPSLMTVANHAPWILTVAASSIDRSFLSQVKLGNGKSVYGSGISAFDSKNQLHPIVNSVDIALKNISLEDSKFCFENTLERTKVKGKIVYCEFGSWGTESVIKAIGGVGTIFQSNQYPDVAQIFMAPGTSLNISAGQAVHSYITTTRSPSASIEKTHVEQVRAPVIASFSSRGPNPGSIRILKPDISAPGIDILASYTPLKSLTGIPGDTQFSKFTLMSGTSMACPHVSAIAAYVKSFHPKWSPAAIRSAILTTATPMSKRLSPDGEIAYGAGQANPRKALNPGLVYDMHEMSYLQFLCLEGYNSSSVGHLVNSKSINCSSLVRGLGYDALNYPTFQLTLRSKYTKDTIGIYRRMVTNVGPANSVYTAFVTAPKGVKITVTPTRLVFTRALQKQSFKVVVRAEPTASREGASVSGSLVWKSSRYVVRSPIVVSHPFANDANKVDTDDQDDM